ncbi:O-acetylhomoserine aminocarboxypropyltransferase/cysteine synthase [Candidatus Kaiserbacteria bacterium]|nr:O-acetylhomoserine aminocarboxypropyltransferase/cysteine synthase [Candidatus Kaiserbacteria bacterium]
MSRTLYPGGKKPNKQRPKTLEIHGGETLAEREIRPGVARVTAFPLRRLRRAQDIFAGKKDGFVYTRINNPTVKKFEERLMAMEGAEAALATSSGMSAIMLLALALGHGGHIVSSNRLYGGVFHLFREYLPKLGIHVTFVDNPHSVEAWQAAIRPGTTRFLYLEAPSNPLIDVFDIRMIAAVAYSYGIPLVVDSTLATPVLLKPLSLGADIVVHSASKYMGNGEVIGGCILGKKKVISDLRNGWFRDMGGCLSPDNAVILMSHLESLSARMIEHSTNAFRIAEYLSAHPKVRKVHHPAFGEDSRRNKELMPKGFGGLMAFDIVGGLDEARMVIEALKMPWLAANIGEARSLVIHPATTTHGQMNTEELAAAGMSESTIRYSVGREDPADLIEDLEQALELI